MKILSYLPIATAAAVYIVRLVEINTKRATIGGKIREHITLMLFMIGGTMMMIGSVVEFCLRGMQFSWLVYALGTVFALASFKVRWQAIAALGKFWSLHVEIRDNHEFVQTGPFRWVRHPAYFSMILELLSVGLILNAFIMLTIIPFVFFPILLARIRIEEAALIEKFGDAYRKYRETTPALIAWKLRRC